MSNAPKWPALDAGTLLHQVQIQSQASTADSFGQPQQTWTTIRTACAAIATPSAREVFQAGQLTSQVTHMLTMRWSPTAIAPGMRAVFGSRTFKVQAVINVDERNIVTRLLCLELGATS